jgi:hypothetical protein
VRGLEQWFHKGVGVGSQCCAMFVHMIVDDHAKIRDVEISMMCTIVNVTGRVGYDSKKF